MGSCKPIGLMLGLPFALMAAFISIIAATIFVFGRLLHKVSPCFKNCDQVADRACGLTDLPIRVLRWFFENSPC
ncbi:hypothetical protein K1719_031313 [Acacia pycnantha]|nr:hypothetical protein K1719_031313 [Acacia pycnantha]